MIVRRTYDPAVPVSRSTFIVPAPPRTVAGLLRDADVAAEAPARLGHRWTPGPRVLSAGDEVRVGFRVLPGVRVPVRTVVTSMTTAGMTSTLRAGPLPALDHDVTLVPTAVGTTVHDELRWTSPFGPLGRVADAVLMRRWAARLLAARREVLLARASAVSAGPVVVATALVRDGRVLTAQRTRPPALAGRWELPGGRVEAGESEAAAVVRECREELGITVEVIGRLGTDLPLDLGADPPTSRAVLRVHTAALAPASTEPRGLEHSALRWVGAAELDDVDWVEVDRAVVGDLRELLSN